MAARNSGHDGDNEFRGAGVYPRELVPAARPGDYVSLEPSGDPYKVDQMVAQPGVFAFDSDDGNGVTIGANDQEFDNEAEDLEMNRMWLGQFRPLHLGEDLPGGVNVTVDMGGKQSPMYTNKNQRGEIADETPAMVADDATGTSVVSDAFNTHLTEMYVYEDEVPYFSFENTTAGQVTVDDLRFAGFQYRLEPLSSTPAGAHVEPIPVERVKQTG